MCSPSLKGGISTLHGESEARQSWTFAIALKIIFHKTFHMRL